MKRACVFDQNLGYVECDVCGDGYNRLMVWVYDDNSFTVTRESKCYGNVTEEYVDELYLAEFVQRNQFLVSTKRARNLVADFLKDLKNGRLTYPIVTGAELGDWWHEGEDSRTEIAVDVNPAVTAAPTNALNQALTNVSQNYAGFWSALNISTLNFNMWRVEHSGWEQ